MEKRAQSQIMAVVLIILISLIALAIVWNFVVPLIREKSENIEASLMTVNLEIEDVALSVIGASFVSVKRGSDNGEIDSLKFVFYDDAGNSYVETKEEIIEVLETKTYNFNPISDFGVIERVSVIPVFEKNFGREFSGDANKIFEIPNELAHWWRFNDEKDIVGDNDGEGGEISEGVLEAGPFNVGNIPVGEEIAIGVWVNSDEGSIIEKGNDYKIYLEGGKIIFSHNSETISSTEGVNAGEWNYILINLDSTEIRIYLNGVAVANDLSFTLSNSGADVLIGNNFDGQIDEVMIFGESLSEGQISSLYNNFRK